MRYTLFLNYGEPAEGQISDEDMAAAQTAFAEYAAALDGAGVLRSADVLQSTTATTTVTSRDGVLDRRDGPAIDTPEPVSGVFIIDVPDADAAASWAGRAPSVSWGTVEVRPSALVWDREHGWHQS
ncbi:YciI family protein [Plantibacter sp. YIM 135347]|uniref:YciI family protein n=1 Tax=Plantibacter sp. YIM 135347 TaxID=3423919 RepID=UPI003D337F05